MLPLAINTGSAPLVIPLFATFETVVFVVIVALKKHTQSMTGDQGFDGN
jgi:hypothetical protein